MAPHISAADALHGDGVVVVCRNGVFFTGAGGARLYSLHLICGNPCGVQVLADASRVRARRASAMERMNAPTCGSSIGSGQSRSLPLLSLYGSLLAKFLLVELLLFLDTHNLFCCATTRCVLLRSCASLCLSELIVCQRFVFLKLFSPLLSAREVP